MKMVRPVAIQLPPTGGVRSVTTGNVLLGSLSSSTSPKYTDKATEMGTSSVTRSSKGGMAKGGSLIGRILTVKFNTAEQCPSESQA